MGENSSNFATVGAVYSDGLSLIFDGESTATSKHYKYNTSITFAAGNRVKIFRDSGTVVVEYVVGPYTSKFYIDGTQYSFESGMTWSDWISSDYNTDSLTISAWTYSCGYFIKDGSTKVAFIGNSKTATLVANKNYDMSGDAHVTIAGVSQEIYNKMKISDFFDSEVNTRGYTWVSGGSGYTGYFALNGVNVASFSDYRNAMIDGNSYTL